MKQLISKSIFYIMRICIFRLIRIVIFQMDGNYTKGQRLFLETLDGTVEGSFYSIDPGHNKLTLNKLMLHPSGRQVDGMNHYYRNEIINSEYIMVFTVLLCHRVLYVIN